MLWGVFGEDVLAALGYLPEYPTCSKAVGWYGVRCCAYFAWAIEPSLQNGSVPRNGFIFLGYWTGRVTGMRPFRLDQWLSWDRWLPTSCLIFPGAFHCAVLLYDNAKSAKCSMQRRLMALRIPSSMQLLQNADIASSSRQSLTLSLTRRNLA